MSNDTEALGLCFKLAFELAWRIRQQEGVWVVHGLPVGTGSANLGRRYWHAWVELGASVLTGSFADDVVPMSRRDFYRVGQLNAPDLQTWRYHPREAAALVVEHEHYGPWVEGYESMGL